MATGNFGMISTSTIHLAQLLCFRDCEKGDESMFKHTTEDWRNWEHICGCGSIIPEVF